MAWGEARPPAGRVIQVLRLLNRSAPRRNIVKAVIGVPCLIRRKQSQCAAGIRYCTQEMGCHVQDFMNAVTYAWGRLPVSTAGALPCECPGQAQKPDSSGPVDSAMPQTFMYAVRNGLRFFCSFGRVLY